MKTNNSITRQQFMDFFRDDEKLNELTPDDRVEIFSTILTGGSDLTVDLLNGILGDYCKEGVTVINTEDGK